jgi:hypothetical protein
MAAMAVLTYFFDLTCGFKKSPEGFLRAIEPGKWPGLGLA